METGNKYGIPNIGRVSHNVFYAGAVLGITAGMAGLFLAVLRIDLREILPPCSLHTMTGLYCPGCGGTRACYALMQGQVLKSVLAHPLVLYLAAGYILYMLSHLLQIFTHGKIRGLFFCPYYCYVGIGILLTQFAAKNLLLLAGYDVLGRLL